jgi:hypothetical protein
MQTERELKERAKRLGYKLKRRGTEYSLVDDEGAGPSGTIEGIARWLDVIEHKLAVQFSTACGMPLWKIIALPRPKVAEPTPITMEPLEPIVRHEDGMFAVWFDEARYPSHEFARAAWLRRNSRHSSLLPGSI